MGDTPTIDDLKALVYGRGRGTGIKITPRHYDGDNGQQQTRKAALATGLQHRVDRGGRGLDSEGHLSAQLRLCGDRSVNRR